MTRVVFLQPALPVYRLDFFEQCSQLLDGPLIVYHSTVNLHGLQVDLSNQPSWAMQLGSMYDVLPGIQWQVGALSVQINRGDVVVVAGAPRCISNLALLIWARLRGAHTIWWGHYWSATSKTWRYVLRLILMKLSHSVIFYTDREVDECRKYMGRFAPGRLSALNNGINADPIKAYRTPYSADKRGKRLLYIGRLTEKAQIQVLLNALAAPELKNFSLDIIGGGPEEIKLRRLAEELGLNGRIVWHGSITDEELIADVANCCALFVYPGSVGLSLIHALTYGLPSVVHANNRHHMPEIAALTPYVNGFTFQEGNAISLADCICEAFADLNRLNWMSSMALDTVEDSFNTKSMAKRFVSAVGDFLDVTECSQ